MDNSQKKHKRQIKAAYKKWSNIKQGKLLNFLKENRPLEKPTAQAYYRRFMEENKIDSQWNLVRCKVRNMRQSFQKLRNWENSTGVGAVKEGETMQDVILKKCPLFFELEEVFGYKEPSFAINVIDTETPGGCDENVLEELWTISSLNETEHETQTVEVDVNPPECSTEFCGAADFFLGADESNQAKTLNKSRKRIYSRTALSDIMQVQAQFIEMKTKRNEMDVQLKERELELQREKFAFDKHNRLEEFKLKEMEIESNEKIKLLEIQMKENICFEGP